MTENVLKLLIGWAPTILFALIILIGIIVGVVRGLRKSLILFFHMLAVGALCIGFYIWLFNQPNMDQMMVKATNTVLGWFNMNLQSLLGVDSSLVTMKDIILEKVLSLMSDQQLLETILIAENTVYIATLVEMLYRIILFIVVGVLFYLILGLLYLIYLIFYPVRRKVKKYNKRFRLGEVPHPYKKRRLLGGLIGFVRGGISGLVLLSFLGAIIFIASGGVTTPGRDEIKEDGTTISFGDENYNKMYDYYSYICNMGDTGIFKILNNIKDTNNTPYYFYIADLVLQGAINDEKMLVNGTFYFRDETGSYVGFCKEVIKLILKYGDAEIQTIIGNGTQDEKINSLFSVMSKPGFATEFNKIIDEFEAKTYFVNLALSALTTIVNNIELLNLGDEVTGLVTTMFFGEDSIKVTDLATDNDVRVLFKALVKVIAENTPTSGIDLSKPFAKTVIPYVKGLLPELQKLSFFVDEGRREGANKLLGKVYLYCASEFVDETVTLPEIPANLDWLNEFSILLNACDPLLTIVDEVYDNDNDQMVENLLKMFEGTNAPQMLEAYDEFVDELVQSCLLDVVFSSSMVGTTIDQMLVNLTQTQDITIPHQLNYSNRLDTDGNVIVGECYYLLNSLKYLLMNGAYDAYTTLTTEGVEKAALFDTLLTLLGVKVSENGTTELLVNKLLDSDLIYYIISTVFTKMDFGTELYISEEIKVIITENATEYVMVSREEIKTLISAAFNCKDTITQILNDTNDIDFEAVLTDNKLLVAFEESILLQCVVSSLLITQLDQVGGVAIPMDYDKGAPWVDHKGTGDTIIKGELSLLVEGAKALVSTAAFDINSILQGDINFETLSTLTSDTINILLKSKVLLYTISHAIETAGGDSLPIIIPYASLAELGTTTKGEEVQVIEPTELSSVIVSVLEIASFSGDEVKVNFKKLFEEKETLLQNLIIQATIMNMLIDMADTSDATLAVPTNYREDAEKLKIAAPNNNVWFGATDSVQDDELYSLFALFEKLLGDIPDDFDMGADLHDRLKFKESVVDDLASSAILNATIAHQLITIDIACPTDVYENELLDEEEIKALFNSLFGLLGTVEAGDTEKTLSLENLSSMDMNSFELVESDINAIQNSAILTATLSSYILDVQEIKVPVSVIDTITVVGKEGQTEMAVLQSGTNSEFDALMKSLFDLFGIVENGENKISIVDLTNMNFNELQISQDATENMLKSQILCATLTTQLTAITELVVPMNVLGEEQSFYNQEVKGYITDVVELKNILDNLFNLFGTFVDNERVVSIAEIDIQNLELKESDVTSLVSSKILVATVSENILNVDALTIPTRVLTVDVPTYGGNNVCIIESESSTSEMMRLFNALFSLVGEKNAESEERTLKLLGIDVSGLIIKQSELDELLESEILAATISANILEQTDIIIPMDTLEMGVEIYVKAPVQRTVSTTAIIKHGADGEMNKLFTALFELFGGTSEEKQIDVNELSFTTLKMKEEQLPVLLGSDILSATISSKILGQEELVIPVSTLEENVPIYEKTPIQRVTPTTTIIKSGEGQEMNKLFTALFELFGGTSGEIDVTQLVFTSLKVKNSQLSILLDSSIVSATISDKILAQDGLVIPLATLDSDIPIYGNENAFIIKSGTDGEMNKLFTALFTLFGQNEQDPEIDVNNLQFDSLKIKKSKLDTLLQSSIISATISDKILDQNSLVIPTSTLEMGVEIYAKAPVVRTVPTASIIKSGAAEEMNKLFEALFILFGTGGSDPEMTINSLNISGLSIKKSQLNSLLESSIISATISEQILEIDSLLVPQRTLTETDIYDETDARRKASIFDSTTGELDKLFAALFLLVGTTEQNEEVLNISGIELETLKMQQDTISILLASDVMSATISKEFLKLGVLDVPMSILDQTEVYNSTSAQYVIQNETKDSEMYKMFTALFTMFGVPSTITGAVELELSAAGIKPDSLELTSSKLAICLDSKIMHATISSQILNLNSGTKVLEFPNNIKSNENFYGAAGAISKELIYSKEVNALLSALVGNGSLEINSINTNSISLPKEISEVDKLLASIILSATISNEIMSKTEFVPNDCKGKYSFELAGTLIQSNEKYILNTELSRLILALSVGLDLGDLSALSFDSLGVPQSDEKKTALLNSVIIRAMISDMVLQNAPIEQTKEEDASVYTIKEFTADSGGVRLERTVLSIAELSAVIAGIEAFSSGSGDFKNISLDLNQIMASENKDDLIDVIVASSVYRTLLSELLNQSVTYPIVNTIYTYQMLWKRIDSVSEYTWVETEFGIIGRKEHIQASTTKNVVDRKTDGSYEIKTLNLFTVEDILAIKECSLGSFN